MNREVYDALVVGAGVEGSACAYTMAKQGLRVLLLEQFPLPHNRGSSHGHSRIIRYAYEEDYYTRMMLQAYPLWHTLANETQTQIFKRCGVLNVGRAGGDFLSSISRAMGRHAMQQEGMTPGQLAQRYPTLSFAPATGGLLDPEGGVLLADRCLNAFLTMFQKLGGELRDGEAVTSITPGQPLVTVTTVKGQYSARSVVVAAGPWTAKMLKPLGLHLPFTATRVTVMYWREKQEGSHAISCFPCLIDGREEDEGQHIYALPSDEYPGYVKVCLHTGPAVDPDTRDDVDDGWVKQKVTDYVHQHMPGLHPTPGIVETCIYTNTPDNNPLIDAHPQHKNIIIAAGFSGSGFKLAPVVGQMVWELVSGKPPSHDLTPFSVSRFTRPSKL